MSLKIATVWAPGFTSYGVKVGRRKPPAYPNCAWIVFRKSRTFEENPVPLTGWHPTWESASKALDSLMEAERSGR